MTLPNAPAQRLAWVDMLKGLAIFAVLLHHFPAVTTHFGLRLTGQGIFASLQHIWTLAHSATTSRTEAVAAFVAAFGYQGVHLFLIASGFGLAMADLKRDRPLPFGQFLKRRAARLLPPYWTVVLILGLIGLVQARMHLLPSWVIGSSRYDFLLNLFLLRNFREMWVWIFPGAFWFVPLIVQLYLCYPLITWGLRRFGGRGLLACAVITLTYRAFATWGLASGPVGTDGAPRVTPMMFFPARLFEFALGIAFARTRMLESAAFKDPVRLFGLFVIGLALWAIGTAAASHKAGYFISDPLLGSGLFLVTYQISRLVAGVSLVGSAIAFLGRKSYSIYLVHSTLLPSPFAFQPGRSFFGQLAVYTGLSIGMAAILDVLLGGIVRLATIWRNFSRFPPGAA
jgi:peptidoglycan/LPS O-acetylase OafA/YrhL